MEKGRLRLYLGAAPGVGKTVAMLNEGHRRASRGTDVVVGVCETHGRAHTAAALAGLEVVPLKRIEYHGAVLQEMDLDAIIARRPTVVLVDELAHTNVPGSRHEKRYQDVLALLNEGINVISTINIQHLESLNDTVTAITGIVQKETVPDEVVRSADQIDLVDMEPDALRRRMVHGHIYSPEQVDAALANYFRPGNLAALRQLALLWLADKVEAGMDDYRKEHKIANAWPVRERVVVALSGTPGGEALLRRGARIASRGAGGELLAVYVARPDGLTSMPVSTVAMLQEATQQLGGQFHEIRGDDPADALLEFARGVNATQILIGSADMPWWVRAVTPTFVSQVIAEAGDIDVHVVHRPAVSRPQRVRSLRGGLNRRSLAGFAAALVLPCVITGLLSLINVDEVTALAIPIYLLATVLVALIGGMAPAMCSVIVSVLLLNWALVAPRGGFKISSPADVSAIVAFVITGVVVAAFVHLNARRTKQAVSAQRESTALAELSRSLLGSADQMPLLLDRARDMFGAKAVALLTRSDSGKPLIVTSLGEFDVEAPADHERLDDEHELALQPPGIPASQRRLLVAFAAHAEAILQRETLTQEAAKVERAERTNEKMGALWSIIAHDVRPYLSDIAATVERLRALGVVAEQSALDTAAASTEHVTTFVDHLSLLLRLSLGDVEVTLAPVDLAVVLREVAAECTDPTRVTLSVDPSLPRVIADREYLCQALGGIVDNAVGRQADGSLVGVTVSAIADRVEIRVVDTGDSVSDDDFRQLFFPLRHGGDGSELGPDLRLGIGRGLIEAMNGSVTAEATPGSGLTVVVDLPMQPS